MRDLFIARSASRVAIDPRADNARAIACYLKAGFRETGVALPRHEFAEGAWYDGVLLVADPPPARPPR